MRLLVFFARAYPRRTLVTVLCLVLAGVAEGIGVSSMLPLMRLAMADSSGAGGAVASTALETRVLGAFHRFGLQATPTMLLALALLGVLIKATLVLISSRQIGYTVAQTATRLRLDLIRAMLATRWEYYVHQSVGVIANAIAVEAQSASEAYLRATTIAACCIQAIVYGAIACLVSWHAAAAALVGGALIVAVLNLLVRSARRAGRRQMRRSRSLLKRLTDTLQSVKGLKAMAREPLIAPVLESDTNRLNRAAQQEVGSVAALHALQEPLIFFFLALSLYGALEWMVVPLADVVMLVFLSARAVTLVGKAQKEYQRMVARETSFWALRDLTSQARGAAEDMRPGRVPTLKHEIRLRDVAFDYDSTQVLRDISLAIPRGSLTVITGPSGAGKTTLVDLIIGLLRPTAGQVLIDGVPLTEIDMRQWRETIGYVPQETLMLNDSVAMNVTLGDPAVSQEALAQALRTAGAADFVAKLEDGTDTLVGERGLRLSGGQRQRLALARAVARRPALLILDEATTALDPHTEREICKTLQEIAGSITLIAICHHGHLVDLADRVYRVADGQATLVRPLPEADAAAMGITSSTPR